MLYFELILIHDLSTDLSTHARAAEFQEIDEPVSLRAGQCWILPHLDASNPRAVYEIMGFRVFNNDNQVNLLTLTSLTPQHEIQPDDIVVLTEDSTLGFHRGAGTQLFTTLSAMGPARQCGHNGSSVRRTTLDGSGLYSCNGPLLLP